MNVLIRGNFRTYLVKQSGREEGVKIIVKNAGKQDETELEQIDKGNAKEKYKGKENGSKIMT